MNTTLLIAEWLFGLFVKGLLMIALIAIATWSCPPLRRKFITSRIFRLFKEAMPPLSQTEKEAMVAGEVGEEKTLLYKPNWKKIFPSARWGKLFLAGERYLNGPVEELCALIDDYKISQTRTIPKEVWDFMEKIQIFAMNIRKKDGGLGLSKTAQAKVFVKLASRSFDVAVICMVPNSLGPAELLHHKGTKAQKERWLPGLASGKIIPAFALTEPSAGSDAGAMESTGIVYRREDGRPMMRLNWAKRYITLGPVATLLGLAFKLYDPEHLLGDKENIGITAALIPINEETKANGVSIGRFHDPLGASFPNGPNYGKDVCLPIDEYVIGGIEEVGNGWPMLMACLSTGRSVSLPSVSVGGAKLACFSVGTYARIRKQFNTSIGNFGGIEEYLAKMVGLTYLMEATLYAGTGLVDDGRKSPVLSAIAKYHTTQKLKKVLADAMEVLGGKGIILGPKNFLANIAGVTDIAVTVEGHNILTRTMMIFGQGFIRCHPWLLTEMQTLEITDGQMALREFDRALVGHVKYTFAVFFRALFHGWFGGWRISSAPQVRNVVRLYYRKMNRMASALALVSEATLVLLRGKLKMEERISARLGDVLSYLYQGGAILKRFEDSSDFTELPLVEWGLQYSLYEMQNALVGVLENFPSPSLGWLLMRIIFPFGKPHRPPSDALEKELAHMIMEPGHLRNVITKGIYVPPADCLNENLVLLEATLCYIVGTAPIEQKLASAKKAKIITDVRNLAVAVQKGVITSDEAKILETANELRAEVIAVDDFETLS